MKAILLKLFLLTFTINLTSQTTNMVVLNLEETARLKHLIKENEDVNKLYSAILKQAKAGLQTPPKPIELIHYEGLLDNDPKRIKTMDSFADIDYVVSLIYAHYGTKERSFGRKAKEIILAWAKTYKPTGNTINENKFTAFYWGYYLFNAHFSKKEKKIVENWFLKIADMEMNRADTPNNNWEAKRCKMIGIIGCILQNEQLKDYAEKSFKKYVTTSYFDDGTSHDLKQRDALHYHIGGLNPCLSAFINLSQIDGRFALYDFVSENNSSVKKSVEYVVPYATGEKKREEWRNTKVKLDIQRAEAGLAKYQPGKLFEPEKAWPMFEFACFYNPKWISIFEKEGKITSWLGLLNSPLIRKNM